MEITQCLGAALEQLPRLGGALRLPGAVLDGKRRLPASVNTTTTATVTIGNRVHKQRGLSD